MGLFCPLHCPPGCDDPAGDRPDALRRRCLPLPADRGAPSVNPHHGGHGRASGRRSRDHGQLGRRTAGAAARADRRGHRDHLHELDRQHARSSSSSTSTATSTAPRGTCRRRSTRRHGLPGDLPTGPYYRKFNPADAPIMTVALSSATLTTAQIYDAADTILAQRLSQVAGSPGDGERGREARGARAGSTRPPRGVRPLWPGRLTRDEARRAGTDRRGRGPTGPNHRHQRADVAGAAICAPGAKAGNGAILRLSDVASVVNGTPTPASPRGMASSRRSCSPSPRRPAPT